jgi:hypothetical protein
LPSSTETVFERHSSPQVGPAVPFRSPTLPTGDRTRHRTRENPPQ